MSNHKNAPFSQIHVAKMRTGVFADRPSSQGVGDTYFATDTFQLFFGTGTGPSAWYEFEGGGGQSYSGTKRQFNTDTLFPGGDVPDYVSWPQEAWDKDNLYGSGAGFNQPFEGFYQYQFCLIIENTQAARWHIEVWCDNNDQLVDIFEFTTDGSGGQHPFTASGQFLALKAVPDPDANFYLYASQDGASDQNIMTYSFITLQFLGENA